MRLIRRGVSSFVCVSLTLKANWNKAISTENPLHERNEQEEKDMPWFFPKTRLARFSGWLAVLVLLPGSLPAPCKGEAGNAVPGESREKETPKQTRIRVVSPEDLKWFTAPINPGLQGAWVIRTEKEAGLYVLRVRIAANTQILPHTHPDERTVTVLAGAISVGLGETLDRERVVTVSAGSTFLVPARTPHYVIARDGDAVYQETGVGPTATDPVPVR